MTEVMGADWLRLTNREEWVKDAICPQTSVDAFFPESGECSDLASLVCAECPVRRECLQYALDNDEPHGIWGGYGRKARVRLMRGEKVELPSRKPSKPPIHCGTCGVVIEGHSSTRYCSRLCLRTAQNLRQKEKREALLRNAS